MTEIEIYNKLEFYEDSFKDFIKKIDEKNSIIGQLQSKNTDGLQSIKQLSEQNNTLLRDIELLKSELNEKSINSAETSNLKNTIDRLEQEKSEILDKLTSIKDQFDSTVEKDSEIIKELEGRLAESSKDDGKDSYIKSLEAKLKSRDDENSYLKQAINTNTKVVEENTEKYLKLEEECKQVVEQNSTLTANLARSKKIIEDLNKKLEYFQKKSIINEPLSSDESAIDNELRTISKRACILSELTDEYRNKYDLFLAALYKNNLIYDENLFAKETQISAREINSFRAKLLSLPGDIFTTSMENKIISKYNTYSQARSALLGILN